MSEWMVDMSEWTGKMYGFYATRPIAEVFEGVKNIFNTIGYRYEYGIYNGEEHLFFFKNNKMLKHHWNLGYNTDISGQGCFCIEAKVVNLYGMASLFEFNSKSDFEPYDINLLLSDVFYYVLILPDFIENSDFCLQIHHLFIDFMKTK